MTDTLLSVRFAGPHVSVQDAGRRGMMRYGVPWSGPMDRRAHAAANIALGNPATAPAIEVSLGGLTLTCLSGSVGYAVAGGGFIVEQAGQARGAWMAATLRAGETLVIRPGPWGSWCYLAFAGDLHAPHWLGSAATHAISGFGGGKLQTGGQVRLTDCAPHHGPALIPCPVAARPRPVARVTMGPQLRFFADDVTDIFTAGPWRMTDACDRMGVRLAGPSIAPVAALDMPSEPIPRGAVQVAGDGVPSVLLADHQTTGGYPKIATVLDCDLDALAQLRPRDRVQFAPVSPAQAIQIARAAATADQRYYTALARHFAPQVDAPDHPL